MTKAVSTDPQHVTAAFHKPAGHIDGVEFSGRGIGAVTLIKLGRFSTSPASLSIPITTPAQTEEWEIQYRPLKNDALVGLPSDLVPVFVRG